MVRFLIHRPVAVIMSFTAIFVLGIIALQMLPVSLLPDIDIPEITVQISRKNYSARELENTIIKPIRQQLLQTPNLTDINSETRDGNAIIKLTFNFGTNINLAFIEVNEKMDAIMNYLPRDLERPKVIKASATDIPVFYINVSLKDSLEKSSVSDKFLELSDFTESVLKKRVEQLEEVALVDVTGTISPEICIIPDQDKIKSLKISQSDIQSALTQSNVNLGNLMVRDGKYQYNIKFSTTLRTPKDIENIYLKSGNRILQIRDIAKVVLQPQQRKGMYLSNNKPAICMAVIKQADARMEGLKEKVNSLITVFEKDYTGMDFEISQDQTGLLSITISNLVQDLYLGGSLAILLMFFFLRDLKSPLLIAFSVPCSLIISFLFFKISGITINIISLAGLILGVGMMIDNSIVVIDNITQTWDRGSNLPEACVKGTNEIIRPLITSMLTNCSVFVPLVFLSGIAGALFYDEAASVAIGLFSSMIVSTTLIPTLYRLVYLKNRESGFSRFIKKFNLFDIEKHYTRSFEWVFARRRYIMPLALFILAGCIALFIALRKEKMPVIKETETVLRIDWNENIHIDENNKRITLVLDEVKRFVEQSNSFLGAQQFLLNSEQEMGQSEAGLYFKTSTTGMLEGLKNKLNFYLLKNYPLCKFYFEPTKSIFEKIFKTKESSLIAKISLLKEKTSPPMEEIIRLTQRIKQTNPEINITQVSSHETMIISAIPEKLLLYDVDQDILFSRLKTAFKNNEIGKISSNQRFIPVVLSDSTKQINEILNTLFVTGKKGNDVPVSQLVYITRKLDYKTITAGKEGESVELNFDIPSKDVAKTIGNVTKIINQNKNLDVYFTGSFFSNKELIHEMAWILIISLLLLYFILSAQFESLTQPLIVLIEIPIAIAGGFLMLWLSDNSINIMSMIGVVVMSGIVINDTILKIDTINRLRNEGFKLIDAIHEGGTRRLKPIIMTNMTTVLAMAPVLFFNDLGSVLQKPLALTLLGGMTIGTLVSVYFIPLAYYFIYRKKER